VVRSEFVSHGVCGVTDVARHMYCIVVACKACRATDGY